MKLTRSQLATFAKLRPTSGTFGTYLSTLRSRGFLLEANKEFQATEAGIDYLGETPDPPETPEELIAQWQEILGQDNGARRMFDVLIEEYPNGLSKEELGERTGLSHTSGSFGTYLSTLRRNGLVDGSPDAIKAITMTVAQEKSDAPKLEAPVAEKATSVAEEATETAEPTKRASKKEEPAPKKDLGKILADWDDEE